MMLRMGMRLALVGCALTGAVLLADNAAAIDARTFNPGRIIDDGIFTNSDSMTVAQIQNFLTSKMPNCDTNGVEKAGGGTLTMTNRQWIESKYQISPPYKCLYNYKENPSTGENNYGKTTDPAGSLSAAELILQYSKQFNINPQVMIVTLQKENGLVTDNIPVPRNYNQAMGFGCPDNVAPGAPVCDPAYGSFSAQLYQAARHFRGYITNGPGWYVPYDTGWNTILWNPVTSCGTSDVYIENRSTVALYSYTPYRPNQAALTAQYGLGDACSAYGNRNFYLYFNDWFGTPYVNGNLLRSVNDATVYLVAGSMKYPISSQEILGALSPLGGVGVVGQSYLDSLTTGLLANRLIRSPDGTLYFYDSGFKLPFTSCEMVTAYGLSCGSYMQLTQPQIDSFATAPPITNGMKTTSGRTFYVTQGTKREVFDNNAIVNAGLTVPGFNILSDGSLSYLSYGVPIVRADIAITDRQDPAKRYLMDASQAVRLSSLQAKSSAYSDIPSGVLDAASIAKLPISPGLIDDYIKDANGNSYVLSYDGKRKVIDASGIPAAAIPVQFGSSLVALIRGTGALTVPALVRSSSDETVYALVNGEKRPLIAMEDLTSLTGQSTPYIAWMSGGLLDTIPRGNIIVGAGRLVKTPSSATVYMTDGYDSLIPMSSFDPVFGLGVDLNIRTISDAILAKYSTNFKALLSPYVKCANDTYLGIGGVAYKMTLPTDPLVLSPQACNVLKKSDTPPKFVLDSNGTISKLEVGTVYPITSWYSYTQLNPGGAGLVSITTQAIMLVPRGSYL